MKSRFCCQQNINYILEKNSFQDQVQVIMMLKKEQYNYKMGGNISGALNSQGFTQAVRSRQLPDYHHLTHSGVINENYFSTGDRATKLLDIHNGTAISNCDLYDMDKRNHFISLFLKSSTDGEKRTRALNLVVALDISGSMGGQLKKSSNGIKNPRIILAKQAILTLFEKLQPNDVFSLVVFHTKSRTVIPSQFVKQLNFQTVIELVNSDFESGGTTIAVGFSEALHNISSFREKQNLDNYQHRIVMLTDVNDNSVAGQQKFIQDISNAGVSTTIIGVSTDFTSSTCQKLIKIKGFNYMCAIQNSDLQTYLVDQFDYTFFPCVQNVSIQITSDAIQSIKVFGSVDHDAQYPVQGNTFTVTKMNSGFPSALAFNKNGQVQTKGGLILVKFIPKVTKQLPKLHIQVKLKYQDLNSHKYQQIYEIDQDNSAQEFYSGQGIKKGVQLFYYTQTMRNLLKDMKEGQKMLSDSNKGFYLSKIDKLQGISPKEKDEELKNIRSIIEQRQ